MSTGHGITTDLKKALSTSSNGFLLIKRMIYSIAIALKGSVILPSLVYPISWYILSSSLKMVVPR